MCNESAQVCVCVWVGGWVGVPRANMPDAAQWQLIASVVEDRERTKVLMVW